ncbi:acyltransferase domain-containing protein [Plantactinospora sp. DSM 117369]
MEEPGGRGAGGVRTGTEPELSRHRARYHLLPVSAATADELEARTKGLVQRLGADDFDELAETLWTEAANRQHRRIVLAAGAEHARRALVGDDSRWVCTGTPGSRRSLALLLSGLGERFGATGVPLYASNRAYRESVDRLGGLLADEFGIELPTRLRVDTGDAGPHRARGLLDRPAGPAVPPDGTATRTDQPVRFVHGFALTTAWQAAGVRPDILLGHSLGEYVAATIAGVFRPADALRLVARRAELIAQLPPGGMMAVSGSPRELATYLNDEVTVSALNSPSVTVVSGPLPALSDLTVTLAGQGILHRYLDVGHPFHTPLLERARDRLAALVAGTPRRPARIRWVSSVTGTWVRPEQPCDPDYWTRHLCRPVRFLHAVRVVSDAASPVLLEVGPGHDLATFAAQTLIGSPGRGVPVFASLQPSPYWRCETASWLNALGRLWVAGVDLDWQSAGPAVRIR